MVLLESLKIMAGTVLVARSTYKALWEYLKQDIKSSPRHQEASSASSLKGTNLDQQLPSQLPSAVDIKKIIPKHCFDPKVSTSMYYAIKDLVLVVLTLAWILVVERFAPPGAWYPCLAVYWCVQGTLFTALFVIGHDCGHGSFSHHEALNDAVGMLMHGVLLCPYTMWKLTHRIHHKNNANLDKDEVFYPVRKSDPASQGTVLPGFGFGLGWFGYLVLGYKPRNVAHFDINHRVFRSYRYTTYLSLMTVLLMAAVLFHLASVYGAMACVNYYFIPLFIFASYNVIITFLHHSEVNIPWYADSEWDFVRGQLSTVDRNYGFVHYIIHSIGTHQMHHMFTKIPHYHLEEATVHFRKHFPHLVRVCDEPILPSFMRMFRKFSKQSQIENDVTTHVYR